MQRIFLFGSMAMALLWLGYALAPLFEIVPADSVGTGSTYWLAPGLCMFFVALIAILLPSGLFRRRGLIQVTAALLFISVAVAPGLYKGRESANMRAWLHPLTIVCILGGAATSYTRRRPSAPGRTNRPT